MLKYYKAGWTSFWIFIVVLVMQPYHGWTQIYRHNFGTGTISTHPYTVAPQILAPNLSQVSWTNTTNTWSSSTGASGQAITTSAGSTVITLKLNVAANYQLAITDFDFWRQRSASGPTTWTMAVNGTTVGTGSVPSPGTALGITPVSNPVSALTGTVNITISLTGAPSNGTFRLDDFALYGSVTSSCSASIASFSPASGPKGTVVTITGSGFTGVTAVKFNGTNALSFTVVDNNTIKATAPSSGTIGTVTVTSATSCQGESASSFTSLVPACAPTPTDLFISEVYDQNSGSGGMIELYNASGSTITFSGQYVLQRYGNYTDASPTTGYILPLTGTLAAGATRLVACTAPNTAQCVPPASAGPDSFGGINDNDKIELLKNGTTLDVVILPSEQPGFTVIRKPDAIAPSATYIAGDWNITLHPVPTPNNNSYCANLGTHSITSPNTPTVTQPVSQNVCAGTNTTFSVSVPTPSGYTYQWKVLNAAGNWVNVTNSVNYSGATTATLALTNIPLSFNGNQYYCQITSPLCAIPSDAVQLSVTGFTTSPTASVTQQPDCATPTGTIVVSAPTGSGFTYSIDNTNFAAGTTFSSLAPGTYTIYVKNAAGCTATAGPFIINAVPGAPATPVASVTQQPDCTTATGTITVTSPTGQSYSVDGTNYVSAMVFNNLAAGTYTMYVKNAAGCISTLPNIVVNPAPAAPATPVASVTQQPDCTTATGTITVTSPTGQSYSVDGTNYVSAMVFNNLAAGTYTVYVKNAAGCISTLPNIVVNPAPAAPATPVASVTQQPDCTTATGTITVTSPTGQSYSVDGTNYVPTMVFNNLTAGTYTVYVKNAAGCISTLPNVVVNPAPAAPATPVASVTQQPDCTTATGTITVTSPTGQSYSVDGTNYVSTMVFNNLAAGSYTVYVKNAAGCISTLPNIVVNPAPAAPATPVASVTQQPDCTTATGTITVTSPTGQSYSVDGTNYVSTTVFNNLAAGAYTVYVKNTAGCISTLPNIVVNPAPAAPATPVASVTQQPDCTTATGTITVTSPTGQSYSVDGTNYVSTMVFNNLAAGTYTVYVKNTAGCISTLPNIVVNPAPAAPATPVASVTQQPDCTTATGTITVTSPTGQSYSVDGTNYVSTMAFNNLAAGAYTVYVKNTAGCISTLPNVVVNPAPAAPATPVASVTQQPDCTTATGTITVTSPTGQSYSVDGTNYVSTTVFNNLAAGAYTVYVKNAAGCISTLPNIVVNPQPATPSAPLLTSSQPTCQIVGGSITVITPVAGYTYSLNGGPYQASANFNGLAQGTYTVIAKSAAGCISPASAPVTINAQPQVPATPVVSVTQPTCTTATGTITVATQVGVTYSLDNVNYQVSNTFNNVASGNYTIRVKNSDGCIATASVNVSTPPTTPATPVLTVNQPTCTTPGSITVTPQSGTGLTYGLDGGPFQSALAFNNVPAGSHTIMVRNSSGCTAVSSAVTVNPAPAVPAAPVASVTQQPTCATAFGTITVTPVAGSGLTYSVDGTNYSATTTFGNLSPGTYTVYVKNSSGCTASASGFVINAQPATPATPVVTATQPTCFVATGAIQVTSPVSPSLTYSINGGAYQSSPNFTGLTAGTYTITVKNIAGCVSSPSAAITINTQPSTPTAPATVLTQPDCTTATGTITVTAPAGTGIEYSINGTTWQTSDTFANLIPGLYTVRIRNAGGCTNQAQVRINAQPSTPAAPTYTLIQPNCTTSTGTVTVATPVGAYTYSIDGINFVATRSFSGLVPGTYTITVQNAAGCTAVSSTITIDAPPAPAPSPGTITGASAVCVGGTVQLSNTATGGTWSSSNVNLATVDTNGLVTTLQPGNVDIRYTVGTTCTATATHTVRVNALPYLSLPEELVSCVDNTTNIATPVTINTNLPAAGYTFVWKKGGSLLPDTTSAITVSDPGVYEVTATNTATGCTVTDETRVRASSIALAYAEVTQDFDFRQIITVYVTGGSGDYVYSLDGGPYQDSPVFGGIYQGEYTITVKDKNECGNLTLTVYALNYPRFFSPNGDGANEKWNIEGLAMQRNAIIHIFDRFGKVVATIKPSGPGWDGMYNGARLPATDYWFTLMYTASNGQEKEFKAHFSLIR